MSSAWWVTGDTLTVLRAMPDHSVDMVMTSPPFLALRSYLPADDPAKAAEIGQEATPGEFLDVLLDITEELRRVLAPHGSIAVELGDTYSGSGGAGGDYNPGGLRDGQGKFDGSNHRRGRIVDHDSGRRNPGPGWPLDKSLCLIPELYRFALAYGFNPLTGRQCSRWRVRNVVRWVRPNPPVGALGDKYRPATSEMVVATMARDRYFDLDAVRQINNPDRMDETDCGSRRGMPEGTGNNSVGHSGRGQNPAGAPPLDWWEIPTAPYKGSHYATFPPALCERPIKSMCPTRVCTVCGEPSRRITERSEEYAAARAAIGDFNQRNRDGSEGVSGSRSVLTKAAGRDITSAENVTVGWTDCGHNAWRPGRVLDIFGGSGTTLAVATGHGRDAIGIDLDERNVDLARERIGMFLTEVTVDELAAVLGAPEVAA